jgi:hypothetical protein
VKRRGSERVEKRGRWIAERMEKIKKNNRDKEDEGDEDDDQNFTPGVSSVRIIMVGWSIG